MPYAEGRIYHDADSHVMETPDWIAPYADPGIREQLRPLYVSTVKPGEEDLIGIVRRKHADPAERPRFEAEIMVRKNWSALGSFIREDRPRALDLLGGIAPHRALAQQVAVEPAQGGEPPRHAPGASRTAGTYVKPGYRRARLRNSAS